MTTSTKFDNYVSYVKRITSLVLVLLLIQRDFLGVTLIATLALVEALLTLALATRELLLAALIGECYREAADRDQKKEFHSEKWAYHPILYAGRQVILIRSTCGSSL